MMAILTEKMTIMIREDEVREAIAECHREKNPDARTCIKLAAYYTILDNLTDKPEYSFASSEKLSYNSGSEFARSIQGLSLDDIMPVMDELMDTVKVLIPKLHRATIDRLKKL